jgi:hypothetical protein
MNQLYSITDQEFEDWINSNPGESDLREALLVLEVKLANLWMDGHHDSYQRDRYDRDARYVRRLVRIKKALAQLWVESGQIKIEYVAQTKT